MSALQNMAGPQNISDITNGSTMHLPVGNVANDPIMVSNQPSNMMPNMPNMSHMQNMNQNPNQINPNRVQNPMAMSGNRSELSMTNRMAFISMNC